MRSENQSCIILIIFLILFLVSCTKDPPVVTTTNIQDIKLTTATGNGRVWDDNGYEVTARGFCWSTTINPTLADSKTSDGGGTGLFKSTLTELTPNTKYYVRSYATNIKGTSYGAETSFTTLAGFIQDISGNSYRIIQVGMQVWMAENLKTTKYSYGESIQSVTDGTQWTGIVTGAFCLYDNDEENVTVYGRLYNWYAVSDSRNVCPAGWRIPTREDWITLIDNSGGESVAGIRLKETGTIYWQSPNTDASNETGFTALPGGFRGQDGTFSSICQTCFFWSSTPIGPNYAQHYILTYSDKSVILSESHKNTGGSIRCIKF